jgi:hypothetical protein
MYTVEGPFKSKSNTQVYIHFMYSHSKLYILGRLLPGLYMEST